MNDDPWKHRATRMICKTCIWHVEKAISQEAATSSHVGRCRRRAPTMNGYPAVFETDWCGDHKIDENKLT